MSEKAPEQSVTKVIIFLSGESLSCFFLAIIATADPRSIFYDARFLRNHRTHFSFITTTLKVERNIKLIMQNDITMNFPRCLEGAGPGIKSRE